MAAIEKPAGTRAFANQRTFWVKSLTKSGPTAAEIVTAETSVEVSMLLYAAASGRAGAEVGRVESPRRAGSSTTEEAFSTIRRTYGDLVYVDKFQADDTDPANAARANLRGWEEGYIVEFPGLSPEDPDATTAIAAGVKGRYYQAQLGPQLDDRSGDGEGDEFAIRQPVMVKGDPVRFTVA